MNMKYRFGLLSAILLLPSTVVYAQEVQPDDAGLQDIIVTAERHKESLQRSSVSIDVISAESAQKVNDPLDLTAIAPSVQIGKSGTQPQLYIRGVGDQTGNSRGQGAVAFNVDGVYYGRGSAVGPQMFDIERIEILKGPQGTLYGRNASGGAINIITTAPKLGQFDGYVGAELGSYDLRRGNAAVNIPLGDLAALRLAGQYSKRDGYMSDGTQDEDQRSLRARLLVKPNDRVSLMLNGDYSHQGGIGSGFGILPNGGDPWRGTRSQPYPWPFLFGPATAPLTGPDAQFVRANNYGFNLEANIDLGFANLTLIPAFRSQDLTAVYYAADFRYAEHAKTDQASGEVRLGHESNRLKWVAGFYYYDENQNQTFDSTAQGRLSAGQLAMKREAWAGFGQATVSVTDRLRLIAGGRYTEETVNGSYTYGTGIIGYSPYVPTSGVTTVNPDKTKRFNYKSGAEFDLAQNSMMYATYATSFKAGGFTPTQRCGPYTYQPESLGAFTAGIRNRFFGQRLQVNAEGFRWNYKKQQFAVIQADPCGSVGQLVINPGDAIIKGANLDVVFKLTRADTIRANVEYTDAKYTRFDFTQLGLGPYAPGLGSNCSVSPIGGAFFRPDCGGQELPRTPRWSGSVAYEHIFSVGEGELVFGADARMASYRWLDVSYTPNSKAPGYTVLNAQLTYNAPGGRWSVNVYGANLSNAAVYTFGLPHTVVAPNGSPYLIATVAPPRTFGARLRYNFGT
jgi:iron complex outermembrane receptor protein